MRKPPHETNIVRLAFHELKLEFLHIFTTQNWINPEETDQIYDKSQGEKDYEVLSQGLVYPFNNSMR